MNPGRFLILVGANSPPPGTALIFFCYKESPARREARDDIRNTQLLLSRRRLAKPDADGTGWPSGDSSLRFRIYASFLEIPAGATKLI